jgi:hypothetical protein
MYVSVNDVRNTIGIDDTDIISDDQIESAIEWAEDEVDRYTNTTYYPIEDSGVATAGDNTTITDSTKNWVTNDYVNFSVYIYSGTGSGQIRSIISNTDTALTVSTWTTNPDTTSKYVITYDNYVENELYEATGTTELMLNRRPLVQLDALSIDGTDITPGYVYQYKDSGKLILKSTAEERYFIPSPNTDDRQVVSASYHWGVLPEVRRGRLIGVPPHIARFTCLVAGLKSLSFQMGGTYDDLSTFTLPDFSGTIGQAYINIKGTVDSLLAEFKEMLTMTVGRYPYMV